MPASGDGRKGPSVYTAPTLLSSPLSYHCLPDARPSTCEVSFVTQRPTAGGQIGGAHIPRCNDSAGWDGVSVSFQECERGGLWKDGPVSVPDPKAERLP